MDAAGKESLREVRDAIDRAFARVRGQLDVLETVAVELSGMAGRIAEEGPAVVAEEMGQEEFEALLIRLAGVVWGLGLRQRWQTTRELADAMIDE